MAGALVTLPAYFLTLLFFILTLTPSRLFALTPPAYNELCQVFGFVVKTGTAEGTDLALNKMIVPTVTIRLTQVKHFGIKEKSHIDCGELSIGKEHTFRICDGFSFNTGMKIEGLVGGSKGGGPICIDRIKGLP